MSYSLRRRTLLTSGLVLLIVGCSGSDSNEVDGSDDVGLACSLLTAADLEAQGVRVISGPTQVSQSPNSECTFETEPPGGSDELGVVAITIYSEREASGLSPHAFADSESVTDAGSEAWISESGRIAQARLVDGRAVGISLSTQPSKDVRQVLTALLTGAVERSGSDVRSTAGDDGDDTRDP